MTRPASTITIRGITYATRREAAASLGIAYTTLLSNIQRGRLETSGTAGSPEHKERLRNSLNAKRKRIINDTGVGPAAKPVLIQGVEYPSRTIAAKALGVSIQTIIRHINNGTTDYIRAQDIDRH